MKRLFFYLALNAVLFISLNGQTVSNYSCKLDNGVLIKTEKCWNQVWVSQSFSSSTPADKAPLSINLRTLGDFTTGSSFSLFSSGKEVRMQDAKPGTYTMKLAFKLSGKPGSLTFDIENVQIKAGSKTTVSVTLYGYQVLLQETAGSHGGLAAVNSKVSRYKGNPETDPAFGTLTFFAKGKHDAALTPDKVTDSRSVSIKPGTYDVMISFGNPGYIQKMWLENLSLKADVSYTISTNLNAGVITYSGVNKDVKVLHLYPAGTSARMPNPVPDKSQELVKCDNSTLTSACPPGTYDVMLEIKSKGNSQYEWRKNIVIQTGMRAGVN